MTNGLFSQPFTPQFHDGDPAGIMFFGTVYAKAHGTYERFIEHLGFKWSDWFSNDAWAVPIRRSECEHLAPIFPGECYNIECRLEKIGTSSFTMTYSFQGLKTVHARVTLIHAFIDLKSKTKTEIPVLVRNRLETYQAQSGGSK